MSHSQALSSLVAWKVTLAGEHRKQTEVLGEVGVFPVKVVAVAATVAATVADLFFEVKANNAEDIDLVLVNTWGSVGPSVQTQLSGGPPFDLVVG
jgi:hypothetical protein